MFSIQTIVLLVALTVYSGVDNGDAHSYHLGECPKIEPMAGFDMRKFLGIWYAIQKTGTASSCIVYNFTKTDEPDEYLLEQISQHFALSLTPIDHTYRYSGALSVPDTAVPGRMRVRFPLSVAGSAAYTVYAADYDTYAAIFTCQRLAFGHRRSATILSRTRTLDPIYVDKARGKLVQANIDPFDLSIIDQRHCPKNGTGYNLGIDSDTFSVHNIAGVIRKAGEKVGDGVESLAEAAKKVYHKFSDDDGPEDKNKLVTPDPEAEWLP